MQMSRPCTAPPASTCGLQMTRCQQRVPSARTVSAAYRCTTSAQHLRWAAPSRRCSHSRPATAASATAAVPAVTMVVSNTGSILIGIGVCVLAAAFSALVFFAIPTMLAWRRTAIALEQLARTTAAEVPDTAASMRLSGLEVTDAIEELSLLGSDLTRGVRASAASIVAAEAAVRHSAAAARGAVTSHLLPAARRGAPAVRDALEGTLQQRARMTHTGATVASAASAVKSATQQARVAVGAADLAGRVSALNGLLQHRWSRSAAQQNGLQPVLSDNTEGGA